MQPPRAAWDKRLVFLPEAQRLLCIWQDETNGSRDGINLQYLLEEVMLVGLPTTCPPTVRPMQQPFSAAAAPPSLIFRWTSEALQNDHPSRGSKFQCQNLISDILDPFLHLALCARKIPLVPAITFKCKLSGTKRIGSWTVPKPLH